MVKILETSIRGFESPNPDTIRLTGVTAAIKSEQKKLISDFVAPDKTDIKKFHFINPIYGNLTDFFGHVTRGDFDVVVLYVTKNAANVNKRDKLIIDEFLLRQPNITVFTVMLEDNGELIEILRLDKENESGMLGQYKRLYLNPSLKNTTILELQKSSNLKNPLLLQSREGNGVVLIYPLFNKSLRVKVKAQTQVEWLKLKTEQIAFFKQTTLPGDTARCFYNSTPNSEDLLGAEKLINHVSDNFYHKSILKFEDFKILHAVVSVGEDPITGYVVMEGQDGDVFHVEISECHVSDI